MDKQEREIAITQGEQMTELIRSDGWKMYEDIIRLKVESWKNALAYGNTMGIEEIRELQGKIIELEAAIQVPRDMIDKKKQVEGGVENG